MNNARSLDPEELHLVRKYEKHLLATGKFALNTVAAYVGDIVAMCARFKKRKIPLLAVCAKDIQDDIEGLVLRKVNPRSILRYVTSGMGFFKLLIAERIFDQKNPFDGVRRPKVPYPRDPIRFPLSPQQLAGILNVSSALPTVDRDNLILKLLVETDIKLYKLVALTLSQVHLTTDASLTFRRGKRDGPKAVFEGSQFREIRVYVSAHREEILRPGETGHLVGYLFPSHGKTGHITRQSVLHMLKRRAGKIGISEEITIHDLRRSYRAHLK